MNQPKKRDGRWKPGESGNPRGRMAGSGKLQALRAALSEHVPAIVEQLVIAARRGDTAAAKLILDRCLPTLKPAEQPLTIGMPAGGTLTEQGRAVLCAVAAGEIAPGQAAQLLSAMGTLSKIVELDDLAARITALEDKYAHP